MNCVLGLDKNEIMKYYERRIVEEGTRRILKIRR
jgi:hypothetical protein